MRYQITHSHILLVLLQSLSIVNTKLTMDEKELRALLLQLQSVKSLNIQRVRRGTIPGGVLWRLPRLQVNPDLKTRRIPSVIAGHKTKKQQPELT